MPPRIPRLRPPVTEQHQRTLANLGHMHFYAVGRYEFVGNLQARILRSISLQKFRSSYQPRNGCRTVGNAPAPTVTISVDEYLPALTALIGFSLENSLKAVLEFNGSD